ncbi:exo-alpha-sialidase [Acidobacteriota bacterium]
MKKLLKITFIMLIILTYFQGCKMDEDNDPTENPAPVLTALSPKSKAAHMPTFTLTVTGSGFVSESVIHFDGAAKETTYVSSAELTCLVDPEEIAAIAGLSRVLAAKIPVKVQNPEPGGGDSDTLEFTINDNHTFYVPKKIIDTASEPGESAIAVDSAGNINVVWEDCVSNIDDIYYSRSSDTGATWSQPVNISSSSGYSANPEIAVDSTGNINVFWCDDTPGNYQIYFKRSTDNGAGWSQAVRVSSNPENSYSPVAAIDDSGNINVTYFAGGGLERDVYFSRSSDDGASWSQAVNTSNSPNPAIFPDLTLDNSGNISVVWQNIISGYQQILFSRSTDNGANWSQPKKISYLWGDNYYPLITADNAGNISATWLNTQFKSLFFSRSADNGETWSQAKNISGNLSGTYYGYAVAIDSAQNVNLAWGIGPQNDIDISFIRSIDDGTSWSPLVNISNSQGESRWPTMAVDSAGNINVIWKNGSYLYYTANTR